MPSSERPPVLFHLHVPKCAGTSINRALAAHFKQRAVSVSPGPHLTPRYRDMSPQERDAAFDCGYGHLLFGEHRRFTRRCVYISATRDPLARFCSHFNYMHTRSHTRRHAQLKAVLRDLDDLTADAVAMLKEWRIFTNPFCRSYAGEAPPEDAQNFERFHKRVTYHIRRGDLLVDELGGIERFLEAMGTGEIGRFNVTDNSQFDDFVPARPADLRPAVRDMIEAAFCQWDRRLLDAVSTMHDRLSGPEFARANGLAARSATAST